MSSQIVPSQILLYSNKVAQSLAAVAEDLTWSVPIEFNAVTYNAPGTFTLLAGHTYKLDATLFITGAVSEYDIFWSLLDNTELPNSSPAVGDSDGHNHALSVYNAVADTTVKLRATGPIGLTIAASSLLIITALS